MCCPTQAFVGTQINFHLPVDIVSRDDSRESYLRKEVEILRSKPHWNKSYFYLWDEVCLCQFSHWLLIGYNFDVVVVKILCHFYISWSIRGVIDVFCSWKLLIDSFLLPTIQNIWQPLNMEHFDNVRKMASEIYAYAPDARVLTTYYCGMIFFSWKSLVLIDLLFLDFISFFPLGFCFIGFHAFVFLLKWAPNLVNDEP